MLISLRHAEIPDFHPSASRRSLPCPLQDAPPLALRAYRVPLFLSLRLPA